MKKQMILTVLKGALIKLLFLLGFVTAFSLLKAYAPIWIYYLFFIGMLLWVIIGLSLPKWHYWYFVYENDEDCNCGIIRSRTETFPLNKVEGLLDALKRGHVIKWATEIDKVSYLHMANTRKAIDLEKAELMKDVSKWN